MGSPGVFEEVKVPNSGGGVHLFLMLGNIKILNAFSSSQDAK